MKTFIFSALIFFAVLPVFAVGNEGGHGGDPYALEFQTIGAKLADKLAAERAKLTDIFRKWNFTPESFKKAVKAVRVVSDEGENLTLRGHEVDAINFPSKKEILVNRTRWREADLRSRAKLVLHEYFGILGVERDEFPASMDLVEFVLAASKQLLLEASEGWYLLNLYYGRCLSVPPLSALTTCEVDSDKLIAAERCAKTQAEGKCRISGKTSCDLVNVSYTAKLSQTSLGLRYCEVLVTLK